MGNIYKKLRSEFDYIIDYGYVFNNLEHHYVMPSIVYKKGYEEIQIGFNYEDYVIFIIYYKNNNLIGKNILENSEFYDKTFLEQVKCAKIKLTAFLCNSGK